MSDCIFCQIVNGAAPSWKVWEDDNVYAFLDIHPASRYHTLVIPKTHYTNVFDIPEEMLKEVIGGVKQVLKLYEERLGIQHVQIISNNGAEARQEVFHLHFHIIPRQREYGQNIRSRMYPESRTDFAGMIDALK